MIVLPRRMDWAYQSLDSLTGRVKGTSAGLAITGVPVAASAASSNSSASSAGAAPIIHGAPARLLQRSSFTLWQNPLDTMYESR